ncbi:tetratricopeptide repeat protein [Alkalihalobacillus sp. LMS39]|uniref:tetratricopeptide repeat protein n=1 Tax=Alkalihalobacillus sp. LMS39 TaxID=2924032 RepID=UPI001FB4092C|nr:tetratricopeptide repeat protein [Alkalihalobacillus sp. LMS39]UOE92328.1 tetratricopeptide repeat protein [Alkalihalobacillus sp. LMS39]
MTIEQAFKKIEQGEIADGLKQLEQIEKEADHETKYMVAQAYYELGHLEASKRIMDELIMLYPDEGELYIFSAELLIDLDEEDEAIDMLLEVKETDGVYVQAQLLLADLYQLQGLEEVAEQKLMNAMKKAPNEPIVSLGLGEFYLERGDYQKSIPHLKKALYANEPTFESFHIELRLAEAFSAAGEFEEAIEFYQKGLKEHDDPMSRFGYAYTVYQLEDFETAVQQFTKVKEQDPSFSSLYPYLAKSYEALHKYKDALHTIEEGLKIDEYNEGLYVQGAKLCFKTGDASKAENLLRQVISLNPSYFEAVRTLASYFKHEENYDDLLELIEHIEEFGEQDPLLTWYQAYGLWKEDDFNAAREAFAKVTEHFAEDAEFCEDYGMFLMESGYRKEGTELLQRAISLDNERSHLVEYLEQVQEE